MDSLASFLDRFRKLKPPEASVKRAVSGAIRDVVQIEVSEDRVRLARGVVYVDVDPLIKSELFLKRTELLRRANELLNDTSRSVLDIR